MKSLFIPLILIICLSGCSEKIGNAEHYSNKWKSSTSEQRREIADAELLYGFLSNKTKKEVEDFLGKPDKIDQFGDFEYFLGKAMTNGHEFNLKCLVAFDNGPVVRRIEIALP